MQEMLYNLFILTKLYNDHHSIANTQTYSLFDPWGWVFCNIIDDM